MTTIVHGPQACGKTRNKAILAAHFGCKTVTDDWNGVDRLRGGTLALTNAPVGELDVAGATVFGFTEACALAGIKAS